MKKTLWLCRSTHGYLRDEVSFHTKEPQPKKFTYFGSGTPIEGSVVYSEGLTFLCAKGLFRHLGIKVRPGEKLEVRFSSKTVRRLKGVVRQ